MARGNRLVSVPVGSRAPRRSTVWVGIGFTQFTQTAPGGTITNSGNAQLLALRPFTIVRTHLEGLIFSDQEAADESQIGAVAGAIVSEQAVAIGITAVPTPVTDLGSDLFFLHQVMLNRFQLATASGFDGSSGTRYSIDSKAMRKVNEDQEAIFVAELSGVGSGWTMILGGRILIKLH